MIKIAIILGLSLISSCLYRAGGWEKGNKLFRRLGCPLIALVALWLLVGFNLSYWWAYLLFIGLNYGALSTYHDYLAPDGTSENWLCWWITGLVYGLAALPLIWIGITWWLILIRAVFLGITIMWLRERTGKDWLEEMGSGFLYIATMPLLLIS